MLTYSYIHYSKWRAPNPFYASGCCFALPAVYHHGPCIRRVASFYPPQEGQERRGVLRHPVVWPGCELELPHLPLLAGAVLNGEAEERSAATAAYTVVPVGLRNQTSLTLKSANVLTQYVASSTVSSRVTWMRPYVSVPLVGQYWSHFTCRGEKYQISLAGNTRTRSAQ